MNENELLDFLDKHLGIMTPEEGELNILEQWRKEGLVTRVDEIDKSLGNSSYTYVLKGKEKEGIKSIYGDNAWHST